MPRYTFDYKRKINLIRAAIEEGKEMILDDDTPPLHAAIGARDEKLIVFLLEHGANLNEVHNFFGTPLCHADQISCRGDSMPALLAEKGANFNASEPFKDTLLNDAVWNDDINRVRFLIAEGVDDINVRNLYGQTPLIVALDTGSSAGFAIAKVLLENNADVNIPNLEGFTPLHALIYNVYSYDIDTIELIRDLLNKGANPNAIYEEYGTSLHCAISAYRPTLTEEALEIIQLVTLLLEYGADPNITFATSGSPLHTAIRRNWVDMIKLLLEREADINVRDHSGKTPLLIALEDKEVSESTIKLLLQHQADATIADHNNNTAIVAMMRRFDLSDSVKGHVLLGSVPSLQAWKAGQFMSLLWRTKGLPPELYNLITPYIIVNTFPEREPELHFILIPPGSNGPIEAQKAGEQPLLSIPLVDKLRWLEAYEASCATDDNVLADGSEQLTTRIRP